MARVRPSTDVPYDLESSMGFLVNKVHQRATAECRRALEPRGLTPPPFGVWALLCRRGSQRRATLCDCGAIDRNTMVGIVDRREAAGSVERRRDPQDRRAYLLRITPKGRRTFKNCIPLRNQAARRSWVALLPVEQNQLRDLLRKVLRLPVQRARKEDRANG
jgi:DNA-binding MarR family transcriptional regulator